MGSRSVATQFFDLVYNVSNCGDGSVAVGFFETEKKAQKDEESQTEFWGESSVDSVKLKIEDGVLYFRSYDCINKKTDDYDYVWHKVKKGKTE
jgi:prolyl oligopeptidase PreP (S9A serine peptidase family)